MLFAKKTVEFIVAGLGNPEQKYYFTRHNAGFLAIDSLAAKYGCRIGSLKHRGLCGSSVISEKKVLLVKPQTYMNSSGECIAAAARYYGVPAERIIIICDDCALPVGQIRIRRKGSDGGHNGLKSISACLGSQEYPRIRIGVGEKPHPDYDLADWVLSRFSESELKTLTSRFDDVCTAAELIISGDADAAMNRYNQVKNGNGNITIR